MLTFDAVSSDHENASRQQLGTMVPACKVFTGQGPSQLCPVFRQKPEFIVSRLQSRKVQLLCQLMDGLEAMPASNSHPTCPAFIVPEQEISPGSVNLLSRQREEGVFISLPGCACLRSIPSSSVVS